MEEITKENLKTYLPWVGGVFIYGIVLFIVSHPSKTPNTIDIITVLYMLICTFIGSVVICKKFPYAWLWIDKHIKEIWGDERS